MTEHDAGLTQRYPPLTSIGEFSPYDHRQTFTWEFSALCEGETDYKARDAPYLYFDSSLGRIASCFQSDRMKQDILSLSRVVTRPLVYIV